MVKDLTTLIKSHFTTDSRCILDTCCPLQGQYSQRFVVTYEQIIIISPRLPDCRNFSTLNWSVFETQQISFG
jgi:hypothetical protein